MKTTNQRIIDAHTHVFPDRIAIKAADKVVEYYNLSRQGDGTVSGLIKGGDGFDNITYIISAAATNPDTVVNTNDFLVSVSTRQKSLIPLCTFHPDMGATRGIKELQRAKSIGAKGVKLHPDFQGFEADREDLFDFYFACLDLDLPILFHAGDENSDFSSPYRIYNIINKIPALKAIAAHMCGYKSWEAAREVLIGTPVYTDTSDALVGLTQEELCGMISDHGSDRVMFGSDYPLQTTKNAYKDILALPLSEEDKQNILYKTAEGLFGL